MLMVWHCFSQIEQHRSSSHPGWVQIWALCPPLTLALAEHRPRPSPLWGSESPPVVTLTHQQPLILFFPVLSAA